MYGRYFVLFAILFTGWFLRKINFLDDKMNHGVNKLIVYFAYPCLIVYNIGNLEMNSMLIARFLITFAISLVCFYIYGLAVYGYSKARKFPAEKANVAELAMSAPNNAFMGFPVALIFFGEQGLLLMLAHNSAMNFYIFTYGLKVLRRNREQKDGKSLETFMKAVSKFLLNPNILALVIGFALSMIGISLPDSVNEYLMYIGNVSTPMAMIYIGSSLVGCRPADILKDSLIVESSVMKLICLPLLTVVLVYFLPVAGLIKSIVVLGISLPTAAIVSMIAQQEEQDVETVGLILVSSTVASIATVPGAISLVTYLF